MAISLKEILELCAQHNVKRVKCADIEIEFEPKAQDLSPTALAKTLAESMPPDSAMLFAATEDPAPQEAQ